MKKSLLKLTICLSALFLCVTSCTKNENISYDAIKDNLETKEEEVIENPSDDTTLDLIGLIAQDETLSSLSQAIIHVDFQSVLNSDDAFTVFAPTDEAIQELFDLLGDAYSSVDDFDSAIERELLSRILKFHVISGAFDSARLEAGSVSTLYEEQTFEIVADGDGFVISDASTVDANFVSVDHSATNGIVHTIDKILIPADVAAALGLSTETVDSSQRTIKELITEKEGFAFFKEALLLTGLLDALDEDGPFTVFAPSDGYFTNLFALLGEEFGSLEDFDTELELDLLREILLFHVVPGNFKSTDFTTGPLVTLSGENTLGVVEASGELVLKDATTLDINLIMTDITAQNGVLHVVDRVLIPESVIAVVERAVHAAFETVMSNEDQLKLALEFFNMARERMQLEALAEKKFTFFFPSDQAFYDLFDEIGYGTIEQFNSEEGLELLKTILAYHCVENERLKAADFTNNQILNTFQGEELGVLLDSGIYILDKTTATSKVIDIDLEVLSGVIHIVDKVLLPQEVLDAL